MLKGKKIVVGVSGGIAVYKVCYLVRRLKDLNAEVDVVMTENATKFVSPLTFETLSGRPVTVDIVKEGYNGLVPHITLANKADMIVVCPATANIIGKFACGIADDALSTLLVASHCPVMLAPAMNVHMYESVAVQANLETLKKRGVLFANAKEGFLACGETGKGRMAEPQEIADHIVEVLTTPKDFEGKRVLVTCGATSEPLDGVRCITNYSSGKMGCAIAHNALQRGAKVTMILGSHLATVPSGVEVVPVVTTEQMYKETLKRTQDFDVFVMAAAPCDYRPEKVSDTKIKSKDLTINFVKNPDIAKAVGLVKGDKKLVVFSAETDNGIEYATKKMKEKNADFVVLNDVKANVVFGSDYNKVTIIDADSMQDYPNMPKEEVAALILDKVLKI